MKALDINLAISSIDISVQSYNEMQKINAVMLKLKYRPSYAMDFLRERYDYFNVAFKESSKLTEKLINGD